MEEQVKDQVHEPSEVGEPTILLLGDFPDRLPASLGRWGLSCRTLDAQEARRLSRPDSRADLLSGIAAIVVDGTVSRAATALRAARDLGVPSILVRAERFLLGEADAGVVFSGWPGVDEIRRKVNQLIACPVPDRSTPIPTEPFLSFLQRRFGLVFPPRRSGEVKSAVRARMTALRLPTSESYLERLQRARTGDREPDHLLESLLVGETYLNRTPAHFETLRFQKLPELISERPDRTLRAWSAGCSSGEEAYYLAATLRQIAPMPQIEILGTDVNRKALEVARRGRYARYSLREALPISMESCFRLDEEGVEVAKGLRSRVRFEYLNLLTWATGAEEGPQDAFDVIFCRNVLLYFSHGAARKVLQAMAARLRPGGALFLGPSETVLSGDTDLQVRAGLECFYLERPASDRADTRTPRIRRTPVTRTPAPIQIEDGAQEVPRMAAPPWQRSHERPEPRPEEGSIAAQVEHGFRLLDEEDFERAKTIFEAARKADLKADGPRLGLLFLEANAGRYELARAGCRVLAEEGSLRPELFYLLGLLHDQAGEAAPAERQFHRALFLDASFYMARFRLAEIHQRRGQQAKSAREAQNLLEQLRKLQPGDLVPLSGGMAREALEALCLGLVSADDGVRR